ncbi:DUF3060 domain-containing protein [Micromonospora sp. WMMD736]|uniref:DUF3060 domain-containing protein n=1 Tax=Micromonospora sp. WMMD736 TaxID=3404112 RepID=UPI003B953D91
MKRIAASRFVAAGAVAVAAIPMVGAGAAHAKNGDTHITGQGIERTLDCNGATLFVLGTDNRINAVGTYWAVTVQGSSNVVIADTVVNDITVYGCDQTFLFRNGEPLLWDRAVSWA